MWKKKNEENQFFYFLWIGKAYDKNCKSYRYCFYSLGDKIFVQITLEHKKITGLSNFINFSICDIVCWCDTDLKKQAGKVLEERDAKLKKYWEKTWVSCRAVGWRAGSGKFGWRGRKADGEESWQGSRWENRIAGWRYSRLRTKIKV